MAKYMDLRSGSAGLTADLLRRAPRRARVIWIEPVMRGPAQATRTRTGVSPGPGGCTTARSAKNIFYPERSVARPAGPIRRWQWSRQPRFAMMV